MTKNIILSCLIYLLAIILLKCVIRPQGIFIPQNTTNASNVKIELITPELKAICAAESTGDWKAEPRHWDKDGKVLRGTINTSDIGQCQINERIWGDKAKELGYDIYSFNGNRQMANWIYEKQGNQPWFWSRKLWDK